MKITEEYSRQNSFRNWNSYIEKLPLDQKQVILDLGCGTGHFTKQISENVNKVIGVDINSDLVDFARKHNSNENVEFKNFDLSNINSKLFYKAKGIWASFTASYFPNFAPTLKNWLKLLKDNGWIALVEIDDLFGHYPIENKTRKSFEEYYEELKHLYDFKMGSKLAKFLNEAGLNIIYEKEVYDIELSFQGIAEYQVYNSWKDRFNRLKGLQQFVGEKEFEIIKMDFLNALKNEKHYSTAKVNFVIATK